jgi:hypothetical protein
VIGEYSAYDFHLTVAMAGPLFSRLHTTLIALLPLERYITAIQVGPFADVHFKQG